jgi:ribonucleotide monophosphatase NagD (HAD superfamily)
VSHVLAGFDEVVLHPDVATGLAALRSAAIPAVALTNGSAELRRTATSESCKTSWVSGSRTDR